MGYQGWLLIPAAPAEMTPVCVSPTTPQRHPPNFPSMERDTGIHQTQTVVAWGAGKVLLRSNKEMRYMDAAISFNAHRNQPDVLWFGTKPHLSSAWEPWYRQWISTAMVTLPRCYTIVLPALLGVCWDSCLTRNESCFSKHLARSSALHWVPSHPQPGTAPALSMSQGMGTGQGLVGPVAGQGCGQLQHGWGRGWQPWGLMQGAGLWAAPGGWQAQSGLEVPLGPCHSIFWSNFCSQRLFSHLDMLMVFCSLSVSTPWPCLAVGIPCGSHLLTSGTKAAISLRHTLWAALLHSPPVLPLERLVPQWGSALPAAPATGIPHLSPHGLPASFWLPPLWSTDSESRKSPFPGFRSSSHCPFSAAPEGQLLCLPFYPPCPWAAMT